MPKSLSRFIALFLTFSLTLGPIERPAAAQAVGAFPAVSPVFLNEALSQEPLGEVARRLLKISPGRFPTLQSLGHAVHDWFKGAVPHPSLLLTDGFSDPGLVGHYLSEDAQPTSSGGRVPRDPLKQVTILPEDTPSEDLDPAYHHNQEEPARLASDLHELVAKDEGFVVPEESIARKAFDDEGHVLPLSLLGDLATPPPAYQQEFSRLQGRFKYFLAVAVREDVGDKDLQAEYGELIKNLNFSASAHLTVAGFETDSQETFKGRPFERRWKELIDQTKEIISFRQGMHFKFKGHVRFMPVRSSAIAVLLQPATREDLSRFLGLKLNFAKRVPVRSEQAHLTLAYVRGLPEPVPDHLGEKQYRVSPTHLRWIERALYLLDEESRQDAREPLDWQVKELELTASSDVNTVARKESISFMPSDLYLELIEKGKVLLADALEYAGPQVFDGTTEPSENILTGLDVIRGLIPRRHVRNLRALFAMIGQGVVSIEEMMNFIRHKERLHASMHYIDGAYRLHITADHDHPGLVLTISRVLDRSARVAAEIASSDERRRYDSRTAQFFLDIQFEELPSDQELDELVNRISRIPDVGGLPTFGNWWRAEPKDLVTITLHVDLPRKVRAAKVESQRTKILKGLLKLSPLCLITQIKLKRWPEPRGSELDMTVKVPRDLADKILPQLDLAIGGVEGASSLAEGGFMMTVVDNVQLPLPSALQAEKGVPDVEITPERMKVIRQLFTTHPPARQSERIAQVFRELHLTDSLPSHRAIADAVAARWPILYADPEAMERFEREVLKNPANQGGITVRFTESGLLEGAQAASFLRGHEGNDLSFDIRMPMNSNGAKKVSETPNLELPSTPEAQALFELLPSAKPVTSAVHLLFDAERNTLATLLEHVGPILNPGPALTMLRSLSQRLSERFSRIDPTHSELEGQVEQLWHLYMKRIDAMSQNFNYLLPPMDLFQGWGMQHRLDVKEKSKFLAKIKMSLKFLTEISSEHRNGLLIQYLIRDYEETLKWIQEDRSRLLRDIHELQVRIQEKMYQIVQQLDREDNVFTGHPLNVVDWGWASGVQQAADLLTANIGRPGLAPMIVPPGFADEVDVIETWRGNMFWERIFGHEASHRKTPLSNLYPSLEERRITDIEEANDRNTQRFFGDQVDAEQGTIGTVEFLFHRLKTLDPDLYDRVNAARRFRVYRGSRLREGEETKGHLVRTLYARPSPFGFTMTEGGQVKPATPKQTHNARLLDRAA